MADSYSCSITGQQWTLAAAAIAAAARASGDKLSNASEIICLGEAQDSDVL